MPKIEKDVILLKIIFTFYIISWIVLNFFDVSFLPSSIFDYYTDSYGVVALVGFFIGYKTAQNFGGSKSIFGKATLYLSFGLLCQFLGQISYAIYYYVFNIENPYPSFGDVFFALTIPFYIISLTYFTRSLGKLSSIVLNIKESVSIVFVAMSFFTFTYFMFLKDIVSPTLDDMVSVTTFILDMFYPLGQTLIVLAALFLYKRSYNYLGGIFRRPILFTVFALVMLYISDTYFFYQTYSDMWAAAGVSDLLFVITYFSMGYALYLIRQAYYKIHE